MIDFELAGLEASDAIKFRIQAAGENLKQEIIDLLSDAANEAEKIMIAEVPVQSGALRDSIRVSGVNYSPGGAGGGGYWEVEINVGEGLPYAASVIEGSGRFGAKGSDIYPARGSVMAFTKDGEEDIFIKKQKGQKAQSEWIIKAQQAANGIIESRIRRIDLAG